MVETTERKAKHRPKRHFAEAKRKVCQPEIKTCPYCRNKLKSTGTLYIDKQVQTLKGPVNVRAYGYRCFNPSCPHPEKRYKATREVLRISLPFGTYGLDVIAFIGWQRDREYRQFKEIQPKLQEQEIGISERHVGRLYRQCLALLGGMNDELMARLKATEQEYGGVIWAMDALEPDKNGPQMYVLYEVLSGEPVAAAWMEKRDTPHLRAWLEPYGQLDLKVLATLSDGEEAEIAAMEAVWPGIPHQMCHVHFLGDIAKPIREGDRRLRASLAESMGKLPPIPGDENTAQAKPKARTLELAMPPAGPERKLLVDEAPHVPLAHAVPAPAAHAVPVKSPEEGVDSPDEDGDPGNDSGATSFVPSGPADQEADERVGDAARGQGAEEKRLEVAVKSVIQREAAVQLHVPLAHTVPTLCRWGKYCATAVSVQELERQFRAAFKDALRRPSRKPSTFGGLTGYDQLKSLVTVLQSHLPEGATGFLPSLLEQGQRALQETSELAEDVRRGQGYLQQVTHLLAEPLETDKDSSPCIPVKVGEMNAGEQTVKPLAQPPHRLSSEEMSLGQQVKQALETKLATLEEQPSNGPISRAFLTNTRRLTTQWEDYLFHCYDIPGLPANNAALEARFGELRRGQRRISGRKETSALRRTGHFQILLRAQTMTELWQRLREVPLAAYQAARERLEAAEEKERWMYRLHRWPAKTAKAMIAKYHGLQHQLNSAQPAGP